MLAEHGRERQEEQLKSYLLGVVLDLSLQEPKDGLLHQVGGLGLHGRESGDIVLVGAHFVGSACFLLFCY